MIALPDQCFKLDYDSDDRYVCIPFQSNSNDGEHLLCPVCGDDHMQPTYVAVIQGPTTTFIDEKSVRVLQIPRCESTHISAVCVAYRCEHGHETLIELPCTNSKTSCHCVADINGESPFVLPPELWGG